MKAKPSQKQIKAILFDADNTIYMTRQAAGKADMAAMHVLSKKLGVSSTRLYSEWLTIIAPLKSSKDPKKRLRKYSYLLLTKRYCGKSGSACAKYVAEAHHAFMAALLSSIRLVPTFKRFIQANPALKLALVTEATKDLTIPKLRKFGLEKRFSAIITSDMVGSMKPHNDYYQHTFRKLGVKPSECMAIGDNFEKDLAIPKKLGCITLIYKTADSRADYQISDYLGLSKILSKLLLS